MRYAFIINPKAGRGTRDDSAERSIEQLVNQNFDKDIGLYYTKGYRDAISLAETLSEEAKKAGDEIVLFACGGDGTANEVANGMMGYDNAILGLVPTGSGNDLVRELSRGLRSYREYMNMELLMGGRPRKIDALRISWTEDGEEQSRIAVNGINIGFDGNTAVRANEIKETSFLSGSLAYIAAVFSTLMKKTSTALKISADGEPFFEGPLLLMTASNGGYCGGGIRSCPFAIVDDGEIELMAIKDMGRISFITKFPKYRAGQVFRIKGIDKLATYKRAREIEVEPLGAERMKFVADGETLDTPKIKIEIMPKALTIWEI